MEPITAGAIIAALKGIIDHDDAEKKTKKANKKIRQGNQIYENAKDNLEGAYSNARNALEQYGLYKQFVMNTSITRFYNVSQKIRETELIIHDTDDQFASLMIRPDEIEALHYTTVQCNNHLVAAGKGAAFGAILLAASGSAPVATALASLSGGTVLTGVADIGLLGSVAIIAGPAMCFFGASELKEAKENLSNAKAYKASAEAAAAKMDTVTAKLEPIHRWAQMQTDQLRRFNQLFVMCISMLEELVESLAQLNPEANRINVGNLSKQQRELIAISYALARYVKTIIDAPLLQKLNVASGTESIADYSVTDESKYYYSENEKQIPKFETGVNSTKQIGFSLQVLKKIELDAMVARTVDPTSEKARQIVAEAEIPKVYSFDKSNGMEDSDNNFEDAYSLGEELLKINDYQGALNNFMLAAEKGNVKAQEEIGIMYFEGKGVEKNYNEAGKWCLKAAEAGCARAQRIMGDLYKNGLGLNIDVRRAFDWYKKAAESGEAHAMYLLGCYYKNGECVIKDKDEAFKWFKKSAEAGDSSGMYSLCRAYKKRSKKCGLDFDECVDGYMHWLHKAADAGNGDAIRELDAFYDKYYK